MKVILIKVNQAVKQLISKLNNRRCSSANGSITFTVGAVTSLILLRKHASRRDVVVVISLLSIFTLGLIGIGGIGVSNVSATQSTITLSVANSIAIDILPTTNGAFASSSTSDTIVSIATNNYTGYNLGIAASAANSTALSYTDDNSTVHTIPSISSSVSATNYADDTYATNNNLNNTWGFRPSKYNSTNNTDYLPIPSSTTPTTLDTTNEPNASTANTYNIAIGARVDLNQTPGSYTNTFIITAIANPTPYTIAYNANTTDTVSNMPANITNGTSYADTVSLGTTTPTRTGYTFKGWCKTSEATSESTCSGTLYNATNNNLSNYPIDRTVSSNNISVSAIWQVNQYTCTKQYRLQTATAGWGSYTTDTTEQVNYGATCSYTKTVTDYKGSASASNGASGTATCTVTENGCTASIDFYRNTYALTINRNTTYISSVSGAGTYRWGQSVSISATASSGNEFTSWSQTSGTTGSFGSTSSASTTFTMPKSAATIYAEGKSSCTSTLSGYMQDASVASAYCDGASGSLTDRRDNQVYTVAKINGQLWMTRNLAIGCNGSGSTYGSSVSSKSLTSTYSNVSTTWSTPTALLSTAANSSDTSGYTTAAMQCSSTYGAWYNYAAATAGTITGSSNSTAATKDICPAGWHLPTGPNTKSTDFNKLVGNTTVGYQNPTTGLTAFSAVAGGYYKNGAPSSTGYGFWWSATAITTTNRYILGYNSSNGQFLGHGSYYRYNGLFVRCVRSS